MKRIFQILCLAVAVLGLASCNTYVEERGYVSGRPINAYRTPAVTHGVLYTNNNRYNRARNVSYRNSSRYGHSRRDHDRHSRYDRDRHDSRRNVRYTPRSSRSSRNVVDARVRTDVGIFR